ncbi:MAG: DUF3999 family protein, partial [Pseudomonadota bacterium]
PETVDILDVTAWREESREPETADVPVCKVDVREKSRITELHVDLGFKGLPVSRIELDFRDDNFFRHVSVSGRNQETLTVKTRVEDSPALERKVPAPWHGVTEATIHRYSAAGHIGRSLTIRPTHCNYRYLLIAIRNNDDSPLSFASVQVRRLIPKIMFPIRGEGDYALLVGNPKASAPTYDVDRYIHKLAGERTFEAAQGELNDNPAYEKKKKGLKWSERHYVIIWLALLAMVGTLGFLVYRTAKSRPTSESSAGEGG